MPNTKININNGIVLDPFAIHLTGLMRKHQGIKTGVNTAQLFDPLHGEVKFKQAFVNACHFADQMTVIGPIAQLAWDTSRTDPITQALYWQARMNSGANEDLFKHIEDFMRKAKWENVRSERWQESDKFLLHMMPDKMLALGLPESDANFALRWREHHDYMFDQLFRNPMDAGKFARSKVKDRWPNNDRVTDIIQGAPTLGVMAVIFTFKKPDAGSRYADELTNLAVFPPMVFMLPCLVPAGADLERGGGYGAKKAIQTPTISTYRISLGYGGNILPYGQPYYLTSVDPRGKAPDTLRSLSDVFKRLWSQATQFSAWNMSFDVDLEAERRPRVDGVPWDIMGEFCLDPMGAGRRIRGHNRFMGNYALEGVNFLYEKYLNPNELTVEGLEPELAGWQTHGSITKNCFHRQLRAASLNRKKETIFVTPSFLSEETTKAMIPLALGVTRFLYSNASLETFLDSSVLDNHNPYILPYGGEQPTDRVQSFLDQVIEKSNYVEKDDLNIGAIPLHRVPAELVFDPQGDPTVFGLRNDLLSRKEMQKTEDLSDDGMDRIKQGTEILGNFPLLDALCSSNTKELTEVFKEVKEKSFKEGTKAKELLDESIAIDLFADVDTMI